MKSKQPTQFTVADYLLTRLKQLQVTEVFQIPGDYVKHFTQALEHFDGVTAIGTANELDAAYAADAYARTKGLGAVSLQYGVSTYSALNAIAGAWVERSPVVVISATPGADARNMTNMYQVLFHHSTGNMEADQEIFEHVTIDAVTLSTSADAPTIIDELLINALTYQRPVYIACYKEVWGEPCPKPDKKPLKARVMESVPADLNNAVTQAWSMITASKNPLIFAGVEILRHGLSDLLQELIDASGFLYTTTTLGKTVLDEKGDKFIGTYSDAASISTVTQTVQNADMILTLGAIITDDYLWYVQNKYAQTVICNDDGMRAGYFMYEGVRLRDFMEALIKMFKANAKTYPIKAKAPAQPKWPNPWKENEDPNWVNDDSKLTFNKFFQHSMKYLTDNKMLDKIVFTLGVSSSLYVATNAYGLYQNSFISSAAWQIVGFETGAAAGAQLGSGKRAIAIAGDGGFMMICQSLSTLAKYKINAVIFVMSNVVYGIEQVYVDMNAFNPGDQNKFDTFDILPEWDYMALAQAFGANGIRVHNPEELNNAWKTISTTQDKPTLVEVVIHKKDLPGQMQRLGAE